MNEDRKPLFIIRNLPDGTQEQRTPDDKSVIRTFGQNQDGVRRHYQKQKDEYVTFVPGDPALVAAVRQVFRRKFVDGWGVFRIADESNEQRIPAPHGGLFPYTTVEYIVKNSIYLGLGVGNRVSDAEFYRFGKMTPQAAPLKKKSGVKIQQIKPEKEALQLYRSKGEWDEQPFSHLENLLELEPALRETVIAWQTAEMERLAARIVRKTVPDRYPDSDFIMKGVLRSKPGDHPMSGAKMSQKGDGKYRYYRVVKGFTSPVKGSVLGRLIPADMIESAAIEVVKTAVSSYDGTAAVVHAAMLEERRANQTDRASLSVLKKERQKVQDTIDFYVRDMIGLLGVDGVRMKTEQMRRDLLELNRRIDAVEHAESTDEAMLLPDENLIREKCQKLASSLDGMSRSQVRNILHALVSRAVVDLETKEVELEVSLPSWALSSTGDLCADANSARRTVTCAYTKYTVFLGKFHCEHYKGRHRTPCLTCTRVPKPTPNTTAAIATAA